MTVQKFVGMNEGAAAFGSHPIYYVCTTTAELPNSGLKLGDTAIALDTNTQYKASSTTTWTVSGGGGGSGLLAAQDEGVAIGDIATINFAGAGVTAARAGTVGTITIPGGVAPSALVVKAADEAVASSTTLQNDNELFLPLGANEVWMVTGTYFFDSASSTPGAKIGLTVPSGASVLWDTPTNWGLAAGSSTGIGLTAASTFAVSLLSTSTNPITLRYRVTNGATPGNFQLTWAQNVSNSTATNLRKYSVLAALRIA